MSANHHLKKLPINIIVETLENENRVLFAYLYGSVAAGEKGNDIDIAIYSATDANLHKLSADLKVDLHKKTGIEPDSFDVRILNSLVERGDIFGLLYLRNVLRAGRILVDKNPKARGHKKKLELRLGKQRMVMFAYLHGSVLTKAKISTFHV